jgi:hypothetical protein
MNVLYLYDVQATFTNTVFEHLDSFNRYSKHKSYYLHQDRDLEFNIDLAQFGAVVIHYSTRLLNDPLSDKAAQEIERYSGLKVLFIQDEYDNTHRAWFWIKQLGIQLVFTVVPPENVISVYPTEEFPGVRFVSNLTGYVPDGMQFSNDPIPPSKRQLIVGYRGRHLPIKYGQLGQEKVGIARMVKHYCKSKGISNDIEWSEESRIYGLKWNDFIFSCRSMLGTESGSNVFDWDGTLAARVEKFRASNKGLMDDDIYASLIKPLELQGLMNQISPRVFETIAARTVLVLFEGKYSGILSEGLHYISLKKDGSNIEEVFALLHDGKYVDEITDRAYSDIIDSGKYTYKVFIEMVDRQIDQSIEALGLKEHHAINYVDVPYALNLTQRPIRFNRPEYGLIYRGLRRLWQFLPLESRMQIRRKIRRQIGITKNLNL